MKTRNFGVISGLLAVLITIALVFAANTSGTAGAPGDGFNDTETWAIKANGFAAALADLANRPPNKLLRSSSQRHVFGMNCSWLKMGRCGGERVLQL
jgi:hypothetical protein